MNRRFLILLVLCLIGLAGCYETSAGPFITDVSYDGEGNLMVTRNMIVLDAYAGTISNGDNPQTIVIKSPSR